MFALKLASVVADLFSVVDKAVEVYDHAMARVRLERLDTVHDAKRWVGRNLEVCHDWRYEVDEDDYDEITVYYVFLCKTKAGALAKIMIDHLGGVQIEELTQEQFDDQVAKMSATGPDVQEA